MVLLVSAGERPAGNEEINAGGTFYRTSRPYELVGELWLHLGNLVR